MIAAIIPLLTQALQGMRETLSSIDNIIMQLLVWTTALSALASVFLRFSAGFLDFVSNLPLQIDNSLVKAGWNFSSGLVNSIFILIFLGIALSYIFKTETFGMKKALPRLIIIALLINFSLLFVKIFVDFGWVVQSSIKSMFFGNHNLATEVMAPLKGKLLDVHSKLFGQIMAYIFSGLIPFGAGAVAKLVRIISVTLGEGLFGTFSQAFTLIAFGFVGGLTFFAYGLLFLARIIVIYLLAIAAPLAFAAYILPSTQKYFHQWFRALVEWTFLGVIVFFLMGLGLRLYTVIAPATILAGFTKGYLQIIFLLVYLWIVLTLSKKFVPKGMDGIWKAGEAVTRTGIMAAGAGGLVAAKALGRGLSESRTTYRGVRDAGLSRRQAFAAAGRHVWTEVKSDIGPAAATKGILRAVGNIAKAGFAAGAGPSLPFGIRLSQKKKKPKKVKKCADPTCPDYNKWIDADESFCPTCTSTSFRDEKTI